MASEDVFHIYHRERRAIDQRWQFDGPESYATIRLLREAARKELRDDVRKQVQMGFGGDYLIPV